MVRGALCPHWYACVSPWLLLLKSTVRTDRQILTRCIGPYTPAVLRFSISFPWQYPDLPPLLTFATDLFHPLLVPLTTYTFSPSAGDTNETVSASDRERLPPGGFSLRDGFPHWFSGQARAGREARDSDGNRHGASRPSLGGSEDVSAELEAMPLGQEVASNMRPAQETAVRSLTIVDVLTYVKTAFEDPTMLDRLPLDAAGNPGAWHAWRSHRGIPKAPARGRGPANDERTDSPRDGSQTLAGDWNWEGVWENRVKSGIENSLSDPVLFGPKSGREGAKRTEMVGFTGECRTLGGLLWQIRFSKIGHEQLKEVCEEVIKMQHTGI